MARTANVFARVEPEVKEQAEQVLDRLGIPMSNAVGMFLRQIVLQRGIPFEMKLPAYEEPVAYGSLTKEQFNAEIEKGMEDIKAGIVSSFRIDVIIRSVCPAAFSGANSSSEIYLKIFRRSFFAPAVYITLYFIYQIPVSFLLQLHLLNTLCQP